MCVWTMVHVHERGAFSDVQGSKATGPDLQCSDEMLEPSTTTLCCCHDCDCQYLLLLLLPVFVSLLLVQLFAVAVRRCCRVHVYCDCNLVLCAFLLQLSAPRNFVPLVGVFTHSARTPHVLRHKKLCARACTFVRIFIQV